MARFEVIDSGSGLRRIGVMGLDLGGKSGVAWWSGNLQGGIRETLCDGKFGFEEIDCGLGTPDGERRGAEAICNIWMGLCAEWTLDYIAVPNMQIALEDFRLRGRVGTTARVGLSSPRLGGLVEGMLCRVVKGEQWYRYQAGESKCFATSTRLRQWGLWCKGSDHCRDAAKQIALHVARLI